MARSVADLQAIFTELETDPDSLGYLPNEAANDRANANAMNRARDQYDSELTEVPVSVLSAGIVWDELNALPPDEKSNVERILRMPNVDVSKGSEDRLGLQRAFDAESETRANLLPILSQADKSKINRVQRMFLDGSLEQGGTVTASDIGNSRRVQGQGQGRNK